MPTNLHQSIRKGLWFLATSYPLPMVHPAALLDPKGLHYHARAQGWDMGSENVRYLCLYLRKQKWNKAARLRSLQILWCYLCAHEYATLPLGHADRPWQDGWIAAHIAARGMFWRWLENVWPASWKDGDPRPLRTPGKEDRFTEAEDLETVAFKVGQPCGQVAAQVWTPTLDEFLTGNQAGYKPAPYHCWWPAELELWS